MFYGLKRLHPKSFAVLLCMSGQVVGCGQIYPNDRVGPIAAVLLPQPDLCGLVSLDRMIGQDFVGLADQQLVGTLRVIWPGQEVTSAIVPTRLNAQVSDQGLITQLSCG